MYFLCIFPATSWWRLSRPLPAHLSTCSEHPLTDLLPLSHTVAFSHPASSPGTLSFHTPPRKLPLAFQIPTRASLPQRSPGGCLSAFFYLSSTLLYIQSTVTAELWEWVERDGIKMGIELVCVLFKCKSRYCTFKRKLVNFYLKECLG